MKFTRTALIDTINDALAADATNREKRDEAADKLRADWLTEWATDEWPKWKAYRDCITKAIKRGSPIESGDLPKTPDFYVSDTVNYGRQRAIEDAQRAFKIVNREELVALRNALEALLEDEVTDRQLGAMGFGSQSISYIFRAAVTTSAAVPR